MAAAPAVDWHRVLLPTVIASEWVQTNLGAKFVECQKAKDKGTTAIGHSLLDMRSVEDQNRLVEERPPTDAKTGSLKSFGGFGEDRTEMWSCFYPPGAATATKSANSTVAEETPRLIHLGVDVNVGKEWIGAPVASLNTGTIVHIWSDPSPINGWGGRIIIKSVFPIIGEKPETHETKLRGQEDVYWLYGHLDPLHLQQQQLSKLSVGQFVRRGQVIGRIGKSSDNGGWFPHVHVQVMTSRFFDDFKDKPEDIDGYISVAKSLITFRDNGDDDVTSRSSSGIGPFLESIGILNPLFVQDARAGSSPTTTP